MLVFAVYLACGSGPRVPPAPPPAAEEAAAPAPAPLPPEPELPILMAVKRSALKIGAGITVPMLPAEFPAEAEVSVIPLVDLPPAVARTVPTRDGRRRTSMIEHPTWKAYVPTPDRRPTGPFDLVVLFPAVPGATRVDPSTAAGLPATIPAATLTAAIDRDGDAKADLVFADWCCGEHTLALTAACQTPCGEIWSLDGQKWSMRERAGSNGAGGAD